MFDISVQMAGSQYTVRATDSRTLGQAWDYPKTATTARHWVDVWLWCPALMR